MGPRNSGTRYPGRHVIEKPKETMHLRITASLAGILLLTTLTSSAAPPPGSVIALVDGRNQKWVSAENVTSSENLLIADVTTVTEGERFVVVDAGNGQIGLRCQANNCCYFENSQRPHYYDWDLSSSAGAGALQTTVADNIYTGVSATSRRETGGTVFDPANYYNYLPGCRQPVAWDLGHCVAEALSCFRRGMSSPISARGSLFRTPPTGRTEFFRYE